MNKKNILRLSKRNKSSSQNHKFIAKIKYVYLIILRFSFLNKKVSVFLKSRLFHNFNENKLALIC